MCVQIRQEIRQPRCQSAPRATLQRDGTWSRSTTFPTSVRIESAAIGRCSGAVAALNKVCDILDRLESANEPQARAALRAFIFVRRQYGKQYAAMVDGTLDVAIDELIEKIQGFVAEKLRRRVSRSGRRRISHGPYGWRLSHEHKAYQRSVSDGPRRCSGHAGG